MKNILLGWALLICTILTAQNNWLSVGPIQFPVDISGQINGIGRTTQVKFHPNNPQIVYAATASGGLWVSNDAGASWTGTGTDALPSSNLASVCVNYNNDSIIYIGTGDPNYYGTSFGVWKSVDRGQTWNPSNNGIGNLMAVEMLMDPSDPDIIIAATNDGIWKTTDGGLTWLNKLNGGEFTDMVFQPVANASIMYAVTFDKFFRSVNRGDTWTEITNGLTGSATPGDGCRLAVSPSNPDIVYVGAVKDEGTIFKSSDAGLSFSVAYHNPAVSLTGYDDQGGGQGNYNFCLAADPTDANILYTGSHVVWKSTNGGVNWTQLTNWWETVHTDMHQMFFSPGPPYILYNANDGGIWKSPDAGNTWQVTSDGLEATECYKGACSPVHPHLISIGTQDNGELFDFNNFWKTNRGGDWGSRMYYDYNGTGYVYYAETGERRNTSAQGGEESINLPSGAVDGNRLRFAFSPLNPNLAVAGSSNLYLSTNLSQSSGNVAWTLLYTNPEFIRSLVFCPDDSSVIYAVLENDKILRCDNIFAPTPVFSLLNSPAGTAVAGSIAPLSNASNIVYVSCGSKVFRSDDRGVNWADVSGTLPPINILSIYWDRFSTDESIYLATAKGVYYKNIAATDWVGYSQGLPSIADITDFMVYHEGNAASKIRVAYYGRGVWESDLYNSQNAFPYTQFNANHTVICTGETVQFADASIGNPTSWNWNFPGASPSSSTLQNPSVVYINSGAYNVTLTSTNTNGSDSETKNFYITVLANAPVQNEGFESGGGLPANWSENNIAGDGLHWVNTNDAGSYDASARSMMIDNYNINGGGARDEMRTPVYDFSGFSGNVKLVFDVAYTTFPGYIDSLVVLVSTDCGQSYSREYAKGGADLATAPELDSYFVPAEKQWRTDTVDLSEYAGNNSVLIVFQNYGGYSNVLYVDSVRISGSLVSISPSGLTGDFSVYPNPNHGKFTMQVKGMETDRYTLTINDVSGKNIFQQSVSVSKENESFGVNTGKLPSGTYLLTLENEKGRITRKMEVR